MLSHLSRYSVGVALCLLQIRSEDKQLLGSMSSGHKDKGVESPSENIYNPLQHNSADGL